MVKVELNIKDENLEEMARMAVMKYFECHGIIPFIRECVENQVKKSPLYQEKYVKSIRKLNARIHNLEMKNGKKKR